MNTVVVVSIEMWGVILFVLSFLIVTLTKEKGKKDTCVQFMLMVCAILLLFDSISWWFDGVEGTAIRGLLHFSNFMVYACNYLMIAIFGHYCWFVVKEENEKTPLLFKSYWGIVSLFLFIHTIGTFFGWFYYFDSNNFYHRGSVFALSHVPGIVGAFILCWAFIYYRKKLTGYAKIAAISYFVLPLAATIIQLFVGGFSYQVIGIALATLITFLVREQDIRVELKNKVDEESKTRDSLQEMNDLLQKRMDIIQSVIKTYYASYYIDLDENIYTELSTNISGKARYAEKGEPQAALYDMSEYLILPEFKNDMQKFVDLTTLSDRMKTKNVITLRFIGVTAGWSEAIFIAGDRHEDGTLKSAIWASRMIHDEKKREDEYMESLLAAKLAAESANAAKTAFIFNMSHDIRTPMNAIIGYTNLIEKHFDEKEKCIDYLHKAQKANQFLLSLINNVLEMARIESGKSELDEEPCNIRQFLAGVSRIFEEQMANKGLKLERTVTIEHDYILCDISKISAIYLNLLSNSFKYTPPGGTVTATLTELPCYKTGYVTLEAVVADTGIGMSEEFLPHIFEEFSREKSSTDSRQEGTGLGMPIVKKLIEQMGGTITVESELNKGTKFTLLLDFKISSSLPMDEEISDNINEFNFAGKRILLAEDNALNAEIAIEILTEAGFTVEHAQDGLICVDMLQSHDVNYYDLILMDIQMPNMDGYSAAQAIRKLPSEKANIPIFAMTANAFEEDKKNAFAAGMNGHVAKPIDVRVLMATLNEALNK